jgi:hypothetical protein
VPESPVSEFSITDEKIKYISAKFNVEESDIEIVHKIFSAVIDGVNYG